ncbi:MAG: ATP-binding protein [Planctomycetota bacterium]|nr:ATP-binding protein [Planctomycetota bacterium]
MSDIDSKTSKSSRVLWRLYGSYAVLIVVMGCSFGFLARDHFSDNPDAAGQIILLSCLIGSIIALILGYLLQQNATGRLEPLTRVAEAYSRGDFSQRAPLFRDPETDRLSRALNSLADDLQEQIDSLRVEHNRLRVILGAMKDGIVAIDNSKKIVLINPIASRLLNFDHRNTREKKTLSEIRINQVNELLLGTLGTQRPTESEFQMITPSGEKSIVAYTSPLMDASQEVTGALAVFHDVTEVRRLEMVRQDFVANVSHELKTPITAIRGLAETLEEDPSMSSDTRARFTRKITKQSHRLSLLVSDLLALARLEEQSESDGFAQLDLRSVVQERITSFSRLDNNKNQAEVSSDLGIQPLLVLGEEEELRQAIGNLIDNALKYTPADGMVQISATKSDGMVNIEVRDSGIGIAGDHQERIFERFYRVDKARSREIGGTGLGLSIVKHVCMNHGGDVLVESEEGSGSVFRMQIPLIPSEKIHSAAHS